MSLSVLFCLEKKSFQIKNDNKRAKSPVIKYITGVTCERRFLGEKVIFRGRGLWRIPLAAARLHVLKKARQESKVTAKKRNTLVSGHRTRELSDHVQGRRAPGK